MEVQFKEHRKHSSDYGDNMLLTYASLTKGNLFILVVPELQHEPVFPVLTGLTVTGVIWALNASQCHEDFFKSIIFLTDTINFVLPLASGDSRHWKETSVYCIVHGYTSVRKLQPGSSIFE